MRRRTIKINKNQYEKSLWKEKLLAIGVDEVGRGCLAGPLVVAAVTLPANRTPRHIKDSKLLSPDERIYSYNWIITECFYQVSIVHNRLIDQHNIYHATLMGMKKAVVGLLTHCHNPIGAILIDAMPMPLAKTGIRDIPVYHFYQGEKKSTSIAAASIVAKVTRDHLMELYEDMFPGYAFAQHKGYATAQHRKSISSLHASLIHRTTFLGAFFDKGYANDHTDQQAIF